jgi:EEF1A N-terminal glycine/lysine methyltransferase
VISDYPAPGLLSTLAKNVSANIPKSDNVRVQGHEWGVLDSQFAKECASRFTRIITADCLWLTQEHHNLARSMLHFLSPSPEARIFVVAGFHTGRAKLASFFEEVVGHEGLEVEDVYEMNADGHRRDWTPERDGGREDIGERKKWLVVSRLKRRIASSEQTKAMSS